MGACGVALGRGSRSITPCPSPPPMARHHHGAPPTCCGLAGATLTDGIWITVQTRLQVVSCRFGFVPPFWSLGAQAVSLSLYDLCPLVPFMCCPTNSERASRSKVCLTCFAMANFSTSEFLSPGYLFGSIQFIFSTVQLHVMIHQQSTNHTHWNKGVMYKHSPAAKK